MSKELQDRLESLRHELDGAKGPERRELLDRLDDTVHGLRGVGEDVPAWAHELLESKHDEDLEDGFDNMPV